jgi:hypothetical protein
MTTLSQRLLFLYLSAAGARKIPALGPAGPLRTYMLPTQPPDMRGNLADNVVGLAGIGQLRL